MKATTIKQIKFNRGQVSGLLSERMDMGLQNACGTVYDNIYINRYGQIQNAPTPILCGSGLGLQEIILCMFDTGENQVYVITCASVDGGQMIKVFGPLGKNISTINNVKYYPKVNLTTPIATQSLNNIYINTGLSSGVKAMQFGYNVLVYGQNQKPFLINLTPQSGHESWDSFVSLVVKENYFDGAFDNIYVRGLNIEAPSGFTPPTSGNYQISNVSEITTKSLVTVVRGSTGDPFTQDLVGQVILAGANGGALQVRSVQSGTQLTAYVLSPLTNTESGQQHLKIPFDDNKSQWVFGYEKAYGDTQSPYGGASYPDSAVYVNQRLIFGGNDYHGSLVSVSRIGVINDFDPESGTESDAFTVGISSKDFCRIVGFVVSNNELRIACTNGEYAINLANLTPSGSLNGFDLRSEVGIAKGTAICDCGGLTAYTSWSRDSVYGTQFSLLKDRYQPISLTSQTSNMVGNCVALRYVTNRKNNEGNCLIGINGDNSMFVGGIDLNAGLINISKIKKLGTSLNTAPTNNHNLLLLNIYVTGDAVWGLVGTKQMIPYGYANKHLVRFVFDEMFAYPVWYRYYPDGAIIPGTEQHPNELVLPEFLGYMAVPDYEDLKFRALYKDSNTNEYKIIKPSGYTHNSDGTYTANFSDDINQSNIVVAGFVRQSDWRSVEIGMGMATRELNKNIIKIEGVIEPTQVTGAGRFAGLVLTPEESKNFITLTRSKDVEPIDVDNLGNTSYTESQDLVWRRAFDNPDREMHYGVSFIAPFLVKSITATVQYDEVS